MVSKTNTTKIFVDGSNPALVRALKMAIGENPNYGKYKKDEIDKKIYSGSMVVCPIPFNMKSKEMMYSMKELVDKGLLVIHEKQKKVIDCLRSAYIINERLDKESTTHDDLFDGIRLALSNYQITQRQVPYYGLGIHLNSQDPYQRLQSFSHHHLLQDMLTAPSALSVFDIFILM